MFLRPHEKSPGERVGRRDVNEHIPSPPVEGGFSNRLFGGTLLANDVRIYLDTRPHRGRDCGLLDKTTL